MSGAARAPVIILLIFALFMNFFLGSFYSPLPKEEANSRQQLVPFITSGDIVSGEIITRNLDKTVKVSSFAGAACSVSNYHQVKFRHFIALFPRISSTEIRLKTFLTSHFATST